VAGGLTSKHLNPLRFSAMENDRSGGCNEVPGRPDPGDPVRVRISGLGKRAVRWRLRARPEDALDLSGIEQGVDFQLGFRGGKLGLTPLQPYAFAALNSSGETSYAAIGLSA
jgi:hypothetical protein